MQPRIYTYKVTFEEIPHWYWGVHKERRYNDGYLGSPVTHKWMWEFYTPHLQILEVFDYTDEGWREANAVEKRLIQPDLNNPLCLNERCGGTTSLVACRKGAETTVKNKIGVHGRSREQMVEDGRKAAASVHSKKDDRGRSIHGVKLSEKVNAVKDEKGRSVQGVKNAERLHAERDRNGKSLNASKGGKIGGKVTHSKKDEQGRSLHALRSSRIAHSEKDEQGRSVLGVKNGERHAKNKTGVCGIPREQKVVNGRKGGLNSSTQVWMSTVDGYINNAGNVALHNMSIGADPGARIRIK